MSVCVYMVVVFLTLMSSILTYSCMIWGKLHDLSKIVPSSVNGTNNSIYFQEHHEDEK